jgi:hypothetical protein
MCLGTEFRFGGQENSTLHNRICIVENHDTLCIFGVFLGNFACGIQGKALEQPHYFRQPDDNAALNCGSVVRKKWLSEAQKGQVGPALLFFSVPPRLCGDYAAVQSVLPQRWHRQWDVIGFRAHTHARFAGVWRRCAH